VLNEDYTSGVWRRLTELLQGRLQELRELNDLNTSSDRTALVRGQISEVKRILDLPNTGSSGYAAAPRKGDGQSPAWPASDETPDK
jgi:hypothetical protein